MSFMNWRVAGGAASVLIGAAIGVATNVVTSRWSWTWAAGLAALVLSALAIQVALSLRDRRDESPTPATGQSSEVTMAGGTRNVIGEGNITGDRNIMERVTNGLSGLHLVLVLAVVGLIVLGVVVWTVPSRGGVSVAAGPAPSTVPAGDPLQLSLTGLDNTCHSVVLPEALGDKSRKFVAVTTQPTDPDTFMREELSAGGFAYGSVIVRLNTRSPLTQQVTITNVKVVDLVAAEPVRGALVDLHTCGGDEVNAMVIHINGPDLRPFAVDEESQETDRHFFDAQVVNVSPGKKQSFLVRIVIDPDRTAGAYTFRLALTYEVDGAIRTAVADDHGRPFRVTGGCDFTSATDSSGMRNELMHQVSADEMAATLCGN